MGLSVGFRGNGELEIVGGGGGGWGGELGGGGAGISIQINAKRPR